MLPSLTNEPALAMLLALLSIDMYVMCSFSNYEMQLYGGGDLRRTTVLSYFAIFLLRVRIFLEPGKLGIYSLVKMWV